LKDKVSWYKVFLMKKQTHLMGETLTRRASL